MGFAKRYVLIWGGHMEKEVKIISLPFFMQWCASPKNKMKSGTIYVGHQ